VRVASAPVPRQKAAGSCAYLLRLRACTCCAREGHLKSDAFARACSRLTCFCRALADTSPRGQALARILTQMLQPCAAFRIDCTQVPFMLGVFTLHFFRAGAHSNTCGDAVIVTFLNAERIESKPIETRKSQQRGFLACLQLCSFKGASYFWHNRACRL